MSMRNIAGTMGLVALALAPANAWGADPKDRSPTEQPRLVALSPYRGHAMVNTAGDSLGTVKDVVIDGRGHVHYLIVDRGNVLVDKYVAVPRSVVHTHAADKKCVLDMTVEQFGKAPTFTKDNYYEQWTKDWCAQVHAFFKAPDDDSGSAAKRRSIAGDLFYISQLLGATTQNKDQEKLASMDELFARDGETVAYAILGSGGFLNIGKKQIAVPFEVITLKKGEGGTAFATLDMTTQKLEQAPKLEREDYADLESPEFVKSVRAYFGAPASPSGQPRAN